MSVLYTYPARPLNGGPFDKALLKRGVWIYEPKYNGWRALVHIPSGTIYNRKGELLTIADEFARALLLLRATMDAEAFKWVDPGLRVLRRRSGQARRQHLSHPTAIIGPRVSVLGETSLVMVITPLWTGDGLVQRGVMTLQKRKVNQNEQGRNRGGDSPQNE